LPRIEIKSPKYHTNIAVIFPWMYVRLGYYYITSGPHAWYNIRQRVYSVKCAWFAMARHIHALRHMDFKLMIITPLTFRYAVHEMTHSNIIWLIHILYDMTHPYVTWLIDMTHLGLLSSLRRKIAQLPFGDSPKCQMTHSDVTWLIHIWQDSSIRDMTHWYDTPELIIIAGYKDIPISLRQLTQMSNDSRHCFSIVCDSDVELKPSAAARPGPPFYGYTRYQYPF